MGLRGKPPTPTAIRVMEGNPSRRPLPVNEPRPKTAEPEMPGHLDREARRQWKRLVPILLSMGVMTVADGIALGNLCMAYSMLLKAYKDMQAATKGGSSGLLMKTPSGYVQQSPLIGIINNQIDIVNRLSQQFGLTPASRTRLASAPEQTTDPLEAKLCRGKLSA